MSRVVLWLGIPPHLSFPVRVHFCFLRAYFSASPATMQEHVYRVVTGLACSTTAGTEEVLNTCLLNEKKLAVLYNNNFLANLPNPGGLGGLKSGELREPLLFLQRGKEICEQSVQHPPCLGQTSFCLPTELPRTSPE